MIDPLGFTTDDLRAEVAAARAELEAGGDDEALAIVWMGLAKVEWMPCRFDAAREAAIHAMEHARRTARSIALDGRDDVEAGDRAARVDAARRREAVAR